MTAVPPEYLIHKAALHLEGNDAEPMLQSLDSSPLPAHVAQICSSTVGFLGGAPLPGGRFLRFLGTPINGPDVRRIETADDAARLLPEFDGAFAAIFWDSAAQRLVIVTDCLGMQPIYWSREGEQTRIATSTQAFGARRDLAAWGAFIAMGHTIGNRTLANGVERLPSASVIVYDAAERSLQCTSYWQWPEPAAVPEAEALVAQLRHDVAGYAAYDQAGVLLLSGGLDSRLVMCLLKEAGIPANALIVEHADEHADADGRFARSIAERFAWPYQKYTPPADFFSSEAYLDYLIASDAATPSLYLFIAQLADGIQSEAVWEGLAPGFALMPLHQPKGGFRAYVAQQVRNFDHVQWQAAVLLFGESLAVEMYRRFRDDLDKETAAFPDDGFGVSRFVIANRSRNRTSINPAKVYATRANPFMPGLSKAFISEAASIPFEKKQGARFYLDIFRRIFPEALDVPFLTGGEFVRTSRSTLQYYRSLAASAAGGIASRHPRAAIGPLAQLRTGSRPRSIFLSRLPGGGESTDALSRIPMKDPRRAAAEKMLFHWNVWEWVHQGCLKEELLLPYAAVNADKMSAAT